MSRRVRRHRFVDPARVRTVWRTLCGRFTYHVNGREEAQPPDGAFAAPHRVDCAECRRIMATLAARSRRERGVARRRFYADPLRRLRVAAPRVGSTFRSPRDRRAARSAFCPFCDTCHSGPCTSQDLRAKAERADGPIRFQTVEQEEHHAEA